MVGADGQQNVPHSDWLRIFERVLNEVKTEMKEQGREGDFVGAKVASFSVNLITHSFIYSHRLFTAPCATIQPKSWNGTLRTASRSRRNSHIL